MSTSLRWFVLVSSTVLVVLAAPECWRVLAEELARPLAENGSPLVVRSADPAVASDLLAMKMPPVSPEHRAPDPAPVERER